MPVLWYFAHCSCVPYSAFLKSTLLFKEKKLIRKVKRMRRKIHCWGYYFILKLQYTLFLFISYLFQLTDDDKLREETMTWCVGPSADLISFNQFFEQCNYNELNRRISSVAFKQTGHFFYLMEIEGGDTF
jgi:hypothetical protein